VLKEGKPMDSKVTLSFNEEVIRKAKKYAAENNISLSRLIEYLLTKITTKEYQSLEDLPIADWVNEVAEGQAIYNLQRNRKSSKKEYFESKK
jgi:hypothetical protein